MISKIFYLFFVLAPLALSSPELNLHCYPKLPTIQDEIFARMSQYTKTAWDQTASARQNFHFYPIVSKMRHYYILMKLYHDRLDRYYDRNTFLERPYTLGTLLDFLRNSSNAQVDFPNALFYDRKLTFWRFVEDLQTHYRTETYEMSFNPDNEKVVATLINSWNFRISRGRKPKIENFRVDGMDNFQSTFVRFTGCWDVTKTPINRTQEIITRRRRFVPAMPNLPTLNLDNIPEEIQVPSFSAKDRIGYYNDAEKKYEAIRIPFINDEFAMVAMLPYYNRSLEIFKNFTASDYRQLLERVDESYELVDYTVPFINSPMILINEKGASINGGTLCDYTRVDEGFFQRDNLYHKPFHVDRPFGIIIYHEKTKLVLMYALVRNPVTSLWPTSKFQLRINMNGEEEDIQNISGQ